MNKDTTIKIRVSTELKNVLLQKAKDANKNPSEILREMILNKSIVRKNTERTRLKSQFLASYNRIGNNINQIAKNLNIAKKENFKNVNFEKIFNELQVINFHLQEISESV